MVAKYKLIANLCDTNNIANICGNTQMEDLTCWPLGNVGADFKHFFFQNMFQWYMFIFSDEIALTLRLNSWLMLQDLADDWWEIKISSGSAGLNISYCLTAQGN